MASLIRTIATAGAALYGVNLLDVAPPASGLGSVSRVLGIVADLPWGPENTVTTCYSFKDLQQFFPAAFSSLYNNYPALKAFLGHPKLPGPVQVCRIVPTSVVHLAMALSYTVTGGAFVGTANYKGTMGNSITATWAAATDADGTHRNLTITIGTGYSKLYENVTLTSLLTLADPYITWTATSSPSVLPAAAVAATSTVAGTDGTAVSADYIGSSTSNVGIRKFYASNISVDVLLVAECPSGLINAVNTGLVAYGTGAGKQGQYVLCSVASQTAAAAVTYVASYRDSGSKGSYIWPRAKVTNTFDSTLPLVAVDANMMLATAMLGVDPWNSPEGVNSAPWLTGIADLETNDSDDVAYAALNTAGISTLFIDDTLGPIIRGAFTTNVTSGQTDIVRSSYRSYASAQLASYAIHYVGVNLSVNLTKGLLGDSVDPLIGAFRGFLQVETDKQHISGYNVDPFGSNTQADIDAGHWTIATAIKMFASNRQMIIATQVGATVVLSS